MLQGMFTGVFKVLLLYSVRGLIALGYGSAGMEARRRLGKEDVGTYVVVLLSLVLLAWIFALCYLVSSKEMNVPVLLIVVLIPALYVLWCVFARKAGARYVAELESTKRDAFLRNNVPAEVIDYCKQIAGDHEQLHDFIQNCLNAEMLNLECAEMLWKVYTE